MILFFFTSYYRLQARISRLWEGKVRIFYLLFLLSLTHILHALTFFNYSELVPNLCPPF